MRIVLLLLVATVFACKNSQSNNSSANDSAVVSSDSSANDEQVKTDFTKDTVITIKFAKDSSSITVTGKINGINKPITAIIPVTSGTQLTALLVPEDSVANIRINQIFSPDGKADGPFGRSLTRKIAEPGNYKLIIGENLMQGDEWKGKFMLTVKVE